MSVSILEIGIVAVCLSTLALTGAALLLGLQLVRESRTEHDQRG